MSKNGPPQVEIDPEFEAKLSGYEGGLNRAIFQMKGMSNKFGNAKYQFSVQDPKNPDELGRISISSITQYALDGDTNEAGEFDPNAGPADFHYGEVGGDYGDGTLIFKNDEQGDLKWEFEGDLTDKEEILPLVSRVVGSD